ncbi:hypothetical protein LNTAR_10141 [Lentisphaera araneosa HTCC2155]|uniref:Toxin SymE-like domain-containing protein n=1 Tax=Lentisphaera araneosa HTCC2155 TaxID=313628 RepID=A6DII1_9BACT|nr:hypothetical protein [Lentisphaera araneosa]EDM28267.1 hypothetical protein LNTAR_10141 [Lentisphaera araneosa HTCC2155]
MSITKRLKVVSQPGLGHYSTPRINFSGKYLSESGFTVGDEYSLKVTKNKITITKIKKEQHHG